MRPGVEPSGQTNEVGFALAVGFELFATGVVVAGVLVVGWSPPVHEASISPARTRLTVALRRAVSMTPPRKTGEGRFFSSSPPDPRPNQRHWSCALPPFGRQLTPTTPEASWSDANAASLRRARAQERHRANRPLRSTQRPTQHEGVAIAVLSTPPVAATVSRLTRFVGQGEVAEAWSRQTTGSAAESEVRNGQV